MIALLARAAETLRRVGAAHMNFEAHALADEIEGAILNMPYPETRAPYVDPKPHLKPCACGSFGDSFAATELRARPGPWHLTACPRNGPVAARTPSCDLDGVERRECGAFRALGGCDACPAPRSKP